MRTLLGPQEENIEAAAQVIRETKFMRDASGLVGQNFMVPTQNVEMPVQRELHHLDPHAAFACIRRMSFLYSV